MRGENSDILSAQTLDEMRRAIRARRGMSGQGHAPLLKDARTIRDRNFCALRREAA